MEGGIFLWLVRVCVCIRGGALLFGFTSCIVEVCVRTQRVTYFKLFRAEEERERGGKRIREGGAVIALCVSPVLCVCGSDG